MGKLLILNGSPRAPRSNSRQYAALFKTYWPHPAEVYYVTAKKHQERCLSLADFENLLFVFPLYADGLPVPLMQFLKKLEQHLPDNRPTVHVLINCGFLEPEQNQIAVEMIQYFCKKNCFPFGSVLCIGSGEAILNTPFAWIAKRAIRKLAHAIQSARPVCLHAKMPLPKKWFIRASTSYWLRYGQTYQITKAQMETMHIE